jgi:hypothetical protein
MAGVRAARIAAVVRPLAGLRRRHPLGGLGRRVAWRPPHHVGMPVDVRRALAGRRPGSKGCTNGVVLAGLSDLRQAQFAAFNSGGRPGNISGTLDKHCKLFFSALPSHRTCIHAFLCRP